MLRHALAYLKREARDGVLEQVREPHFRPLVREWLASEWPLELVRESGDGAPLLHLRIGMPPDFARKEFLVRLPREALRAVRRPCCLGEVIENAPATWQERLAALGNAAHAHQLSLDVVGDFAWQALVGWPYVENDSRVNLICRPGSVAQIVAFDRLLAGWEREFGRWATLEIAFPSGQAVMREEWLQARLRRAPTTRVRTIALREVSFESVYALEAQLAAG